MRSSSDQINNSYTEELSWTDESGSDHSLAENEVMLYSLLHHEHQDSNIPEETALDITPSSRTKANRLDQVQYVTGQYNSMATKKSYASNHFGRRNLSTFNGFNQNRYTNRHGEMAPKGLEGTKKRNRPARFKTKRKPNRSAASVQNLITEVYKLSAENSPDNVITLYESPSKSPSSPYSSLFLNVSYNSKNHCLPSARKSNSVQPDSAVQSVIELPGASLRPEIRTSELSGTPPRKDCPETVVPSKYDLKLSSQKSKEPVICPDVITLDSDNESIDSVIEVRPPTPPPPLVINIDSSDESSKTPLEKNKIVINVSKSKNASAAERSDQNTSKRNVTAEPEPNKVPGEDTAAKGTKDTAVAAVASEDAAVAASNEDTAPSASNEDTAPPVSNEVATPSISNEDNAPLVSNEETTATVSNDEIILSVSYEDPVLPRNSVDTALPGPSTDSPVFVMENVRKKTSGRHLGTPRSWTKRMTKFYCESWGGHNFDHQKLISEMSESDEKWLVKDVDFRPHVKNRRFCNRCKQRGHPHWECNEDRKVPLCFMCGESGHSEPWCPNKICLVCGRPSGAYLYGCQNCHFETKHCAACGIKGHYIWQCPTAWRSYHATTSMGDGLVPEVMKEYHKQECCKCAQRGHSAFWCSSVHDRHLSKQIPPRFVGGWSRHGAARGVGRNHNNIRLGILPSKNMKKANKHVKMNWHQKEALLKRKEQAKKRRMKRKQKKAEKLDHFNA